MSANTPHRYWITGASSGIGKSLTRQLAEQGEQLVISSRNREVLDAIAEQYPGQIQVLPCDVTDTDLMQNLFENYAPQLENLDGVFICAGYCEYIDLPDFNLPAFARVMSVNFQGTVNACAAAYPLLMKAAGQGKTKPFITALCSMSSYLGFPRAEAYGASKAAMSYFLESLRADIGEAIDVIPVFMGFVDTPMTAQNDFPMPFILSADEAARGILKKLKKRPLRIHHPWRLHLVLKFFTQFQRLWFGLVMPRLRRAGGKTS